MEKRVSGVEAFSETLRGQQGRSTGLLSQGTEQSCQKKVRSNARSKNILQSQREKKDASLIVRD